MSKIPDPNKMQRIRGPKITEKDLDRVKIRITTYLDKDLLDILKQMAETQGGRYQTLLNEVLRNSLTGKSNLGNLSDRIDRLEREVFEKKKAS